MDDTQFFKQLGTRIESMRTDRGLSLVELAYRCEFDKSNLVRIEKGRTKPTVTTLIRICQSLEIELSELFKNIPLPEKEQ